MTIKITEQNGRILVRRWSYSTEKKRSVPSTVYSVKRWDAPAELPADTVKAHKVDKSEQQDYIEFMKEKSVESKRNSAKVGLRLLLDNLNKAKTALEDPELMNELDVDGYENLSNAINEIKKIVTKNKNSLKRKAKNTPKTGGLYKLFEVSHEPHTSGRRLIGTFDGWVIDGTDEDAIDALYPLVTASIQESVDRGVLDGVIYAGTHWDVINENGNVVKSWDSSMWKNKMVEPSNS